MECLYRGEKDQVFEYDATGHHPNSAIALGKLPGEKDWIRTENVEEWLSGISGVGNVYFEFPGKERYPCLPVFHQDSLVFPLKGVSYCSVSEARLAVSKKAKITLISGYYYRDGLTVLPQYLMKLQGIRDASDNPALKQLLKLLSNSVIGKLFQKNVGMDIKEIQRLAAFYQIPEAEVTRLKGIATRKDVVSVGSCWYPEWYSLILGYARANISDQAGKHKAIVISSDSFVTDKELESPFTVDGITFKIKANGSYVGYRARFYRVGDKIAHHAVHNYEASKDVLASFSEEAAFKYTAQRVVHLRESWISKLPFGSRFSRPMSVFLGYDYKRELMEDGSTKPWKTVEDREAFLESVK